VGGAYAAEGVSIGGFDLLSARCVNLFLRANILNFRANTFDLQPHIQVSSPKIKN